MFDVDESRAWAYGLIREYIEDMAKIAESAAEALKDVSGDVALRAFAVALRDCCKNFKPPQQRQ